MDFISVLRGLFGLTIITGLAIIFSKNKKKINWRLVSTDMLHQFTFAFIVVKTDIGRKIFSYVSKFFVWLISFASNGAQFVFGGMSPLAENRRSDIAKLGLKSLPGGTIAIWLTASIAGILAS
jgi:nucleoside permease NupC